jgi:hypothetical protein
VINESDLQDEKQFDPRISAFRPISIHFLRAEKKKI